MLNQIFDLRSLLFSTKIILSLATLATLAGWHWQGDTGRRVGGGGGARDRRHIRRSSCMGFPNGHYVHNGQNVTNCVAREEGATVYGVRGEYGKVAPPPPHKILQKNGNLLFYIYVLLFFINIPFGAPQAGARGVSHTLTPRYATTTHLTSYI